MISLSVTQRSYFKGIWDCCLEGVSGTIQQPQAKYCPLSKDQWMTLFLRCHDKSRTRRECGRMFRREIAKAFGLNPSGEVEIWYFDQPLYLWSCGYTSQSYHALIKQCAEHFCVPVGEIEKLPLYGCAEREMQHKYETSQRDKFYSRYRDCDGAM